MGRLAVKGVLLLFPGQGSQTVGMGRHLWETYAACREVFREAEDILGWDLRGLCLNGPQEELTRTDRAQPAIFVCSVAAWLALRDLGLGFEIALGHSLGEFSALVATGQLDFDAALRVVQARGRAMYQCGLLEAGTMAAIVGLDDQVVEQVCRDAGEVWPANYNCPGQVVVSGTPGGVERAEALARGRGAKRVIPLQVSGAFHSPLVAGAAEKLAEALASLPVGEPRQGRFFSTTEVRYPDSSEVKQVLLGQLTSPVRFTQSLEKVLPGATLGVEVGPGNVLAGLVKRVRRDLNVFGTSDAASMEAALRAAAAQVQA
jgi:[acyl-carrier-protein] S-malonyltransferase